MSMPKRPGSRKSTGPSSSGGSADTAHIIDQFDHAADFVHKSYLNERLHVLYFSHLVNEDRLERDLLPLC